MDSTPFSKKCDIMNDFYMDYAGSEEYDEFISINDFGFPAAALVVNGGAILTDIGQSFVEETWIALCELLGTDHYGQYDSLEELMEDE